MQGKPCRRRRPVRVSVPPPRRPSKRLGDRDRSPRRRPPPRPTSPPAAAPGDSAGTPAPGGPAPGPRDRRPTDMTSRPANVLRVPLARRTARQAGIDLSALKKWAKRTDRSGGYRAARKGGAAAPLTGAYAPVAHLPPRQSRGLHAGHRRASQAGAAFLDAQSHRSPTGRGEGNNPHFYYRWISRSMR